jgi:hypothetical protein
VKIDEKKECEQQEEAARKRYKQPATKSEKSQKTAKRVHRIAWSSWWKTRWIKRFWLVVDKQRSSFEASLAIPSYLVWLPNGFEGNPDIKYDEKTTAKAMQVNSKPFPSTFLLFTSHQLSVRAFTPIWAFMKGEKSQKCKSSWLNRTCCVLE